MRNPLILLILSCCSLSAVAQQFDIRTLERNGDQLVIHYDLIDTTKGRTYTVFVYSSRDNFLAPLTKVSGDVSLEVKPGTNRKIIWNAKEELGATFSGEVELEVRGRMYVPFIVFEGFADVPVRKRKSPFIVKWSGGTRQNVLNFQLYQGERLVHTFPNAPNEFEYTIELPVSVRPGIGYFFRISDSKNRDQIVITPQFQVKRKVPLVLQAVPLVAAGGFGYWLITRDIGLGWIDDAPGPPPEN